MLRPFALYQAATLAEASDVLAREGSDAAIYAGGTELLLVMKAGLSRVAHLVDVKGVPGLAAIAAENGHVAVGATATHRTVEHDAIVRARCPLVGRVARHVANVRVRNVGTVGGNLAFADPHSDLATVFLTFDATLRLASRRGERTLALAEFVRGAYETAREEDEILTAVRLTPWPANTAGAYAKFGVHERPTLGVAVALTVSNGGVAGARLAVGCVGPRPRRVPAAEERLRGRSLADVERHADEIGAVVAAETEPVDDLHGSAEYKRDMTRVFVKRALLVAAARADGREIAARHPHTVIV
ncbi:MAG TPA: xanthine dehydrogenase family protein subunit M [Methylomirabilota bacterium]|nr:xanthine dehydrogenase family protein subunit M [Methylomirabilota bacterium]